MLHYEEVAKGLYLVTTDANEYWKCNGLVITDAEDSKIVLIDCNFNEEEIESLLKKFGNNIAAYFISHVHIDHVQYTHLYEKLGIPIHCPIPENEYIKDLNLFLNDNGAIDYGIDRLFVKYVENFTNFRLLTSTFPYSPDDVFNFENITLRSIPLPGHSPGHSGFEIIRINSDKKANTYKDVLFAADIGLDEFGPWYGFKYCDVAQYRESIDRIESIYNNGDYILLSGHGPVIREKQDDIFEKVRDRLNESQARLVEVLKTTPKEINKLVYKGIYYNTSVLDKMEENMKNLYLFYEAYSIVNLLDELDRS